MEGVDPTLSGQKQVISEDVLFMVGRNVRGFAHALALAPKVPRAQVTFAENVGVALAVVPTGTVLAVTYDPTVSTVAQFKAAVTGLPAADALLTVTGTDADVFPVLASIVPNPVLLYAIRKAAPVTVFLRDADGFAIPLTGSSLHVTADLDAFSASPDSCLSVGSTDGTSTGARKVTKIRDDGTLADDRDNWDDDITVSLVGARAAPGLEITDLLGHSLSGRSLTVMSSNGTAVIKLDRPSTTLTALAAAQYGTIAIDTVANRFTRTVGSWASDAGGTKANGYPLNYAAPGTRVTIVGSDHNDGTYTVVNVTGGGTELNVAEALVGPDEVASALIAVTGYRPKTGKSITALAWPATVQIEQEFTKVYVENAAQLGGSMVLAVGDRV